ncbi:MAG TPA: sugar transferase [Tepidiformaceae bacterium]
MAARAGLHPNVASVVAGDHAASRQWKAAHRDFARPEQWLKRSFDIAAAGLLGGMTLPIVVAAATVILAVDHHVPFLADWRVGRDGRLFRCWKLRTMTTDSSVLQGYLDDHPEERARYEVSRKLRYDPRVTRLGRILRSFSLDELPQFINVLFGEMSIVGPRPISEREWVYRGHRREVLATVRPGLTGLWQVSGRSDILPRTRVALDYLYVRHRSIPLDIAIMARTPWAVLTRRGAR